MDYCIPIINISLKYELLELLMYGISDRCARNILTVVEVLIELLSRSSAIPKNNMIKVVKPSQIDNRHVNNNWNNDMQL